MAWITPVTDRTDAVNITCDDINRMMNNMQEVGGTPLKTDYTNTDFVYEDEWDALITFLHDEGYINIDSSSHYSNLNAIEAALEELHNA